MACSLVSINEPCPKFDCYVSPNESFLGGLLSSWEDNVEEKEKREFQN